jgi:hypothetical protein
VTLYIFGDSYAFNYGPKRSWHSQVSNNLGIRPKSLALWASGLDYTYHCWELCRNDFKDGDIALVCLTHFNRRWFFENYPELTGKSYQIAPFQDLQRYRKIITKETLQAVDDYYQYLDNNRCHTLALVNWLDVIDTFSKRVNLKVQILPCFPVSEDIVNRQISRWPNLRIAHGNLYENVSNVEFISQDKMSPPWPKNGYDPRTNHMAWRNHDVLAGKVVTAIKNNTEINLRDGFNADLFDGDISLEDFKKSPEIKENPLTFAFNSLLDNKRT